MLCLRIATPDLPKELEGLTELATWIVHCLRERQRERAWYNRHHGRFPTAPSPSWLAIKLVLEESHHWLEGNDQPFMVWSQKSRVHQVHQEAQLSPGSVCPVLHQVQLYCSLSPWFQKQQGRRPVPPVRGLRGGWVLWQHHSLLLGGWSYMLRHWDQANECHSRSTCS